MNFAQSVLVPRSSKGSVFNIKIPSVLHCGGCGVSHHVNAFVVQISTSKSLPMSDDHFEKKLERYPTCFGARNCIHVFFASQSLRLLALLKCLWFIDR